MILTAVVTSKGNTMKPPEGWELHDERWWIKQYEIGNGKWILAFFNTLPDDGKLDYPAAWVNIMPGKWSPKATYTVGSDRETKVPFPAGLLEVECVIREWTQEVLDETL